MLELGLALFGTGEALVGQTLAPAEEAWVWGPPEHVPQYLCSCTDGSGDVHILIPLAGLGAESTMVSAGTESQQ